MRMVGVPGTSQTTPGRGEVNPHYRLFRKHKSLKGSLNKAVKYMECMAEPAPSLGVVGHASSAPDTPGAGMCWKHPHHEPRRSTGVNSCAAKLGCGV